MNKYICKGVIVERKTDPAKCGIVIALDRKNKLLIAQQGDSYWSDKFKNVNVVSYKEVK